MKTIGLILLIFLMSGANAWAGTSDQIVYQLRRLADASELRNELMQKYINLVDKEQVRKSAYIIEVDNGKN